MEKDELVRNFILAEAVQTDKLVYSPPLCVVNQLADRGITVSKMYVVRMYARLGIVFQNGLWVKSVR